MNNDDETDGNRYNSLIQHSRYYDTENLRKTLHENINSFTILSTNIESFNSKFDELTIFIKLLREFEFEFSTISLQECWLNNESQNLNIEGYTCIQQPSGAGGYGPLFILLFCII